MRELDERAMELQKAEEDCRKAINVATKDYNKALVSNRIIFLNLYNITENHRHTMYRAALIIIVVHSVLILTT